MDYGCGKGGLVKALAGKYPDIKVYGYDPAVEEFSVMPVEKVDLIVNTDVLEHIPEDELPETVARIAGISQNVFFHLHHGKATAILPNGENAHCTIYSPEQYRLLFKKYFSELTFLPGLNAINTICLTFELPQSVAEKCRQFLFGHDKLYIQTLPDLINILQNYNEILLFPVGNEGHNALEYLQYLNLIDRISCIASFQNSPLTFNHKLPVVFLKYLMHFRETSIVIAVAPMEFHDTIFLEFKRLAFRNILFLSENLIAQLQVDLNKLMASSHIMSRFVNDFQKKITELEYRIAEQNEICAVNTRAFSDYRNRFRGKKIVIVGSGPTVKYYSPIPNTIHIALNYAWQRNDIVFDYLFTQDNAKNKTAELKIESGFSKIRDKIFVGKYLPRVSYHHNTFPENTSFIKKVARFYLGDGTSDQPIYQDICYHHIYSNGTVAFSALHFALFTYPAEIYLVGCDTSLNGYFYDAVKNYLSVGRIKMGYVRFKIFAEIYYPDVKIISINPVGLKGLFHDVYTDEFLRE